MKANGYLPAGLNRELGVKILCKGPLKMLGSAPK